ncbi:MAG TPA: pilus assembly protein TadG-related protein [Stellaceae bacterium]|nr:pilus assembly protein TadG-related protein [Stellaceae bacterium]
MPRPHSMLSPLWRRLWRDRRGNYSMIVVLLLPVLTGFVGVGTEAGLWLYDQQSQQTATDSAAFSAAIYYKAQEPVSGSDTTSGPNGQAQALAVVANYGFAGTASCASSGNVRTCTAPANCNVNAPGVGTPCVLVNNPPVAGSQAGNTAAFEVIISQSPQQLFSKVLMSTPVVIKARTVGWVNATQQQTQTQGNSPCTGPQCVCVKVTATVNVADAGNFSGTAALNLNGCSIEVDDPNSAGLNLSGTARVSAADVYLANANLQYTSSGTLCGGANQAVNPCNAVTGTLAAPAAGGYADPYQAQLANATLPNGSPAIPTITSAAAGGCQGASIGIGASIGPATAGGTIYYSQVRITSNATLKPGIYYICPSGSFSISGSSTTTVQTAPFPLPSGCATPYSLCLNGNTTMPFVSPDGVTIVLLGLTGAGNTVTNCASFSLSGGANLNLVPPNTGPFSGIVITSSIGCTPPAIGAQNALGTANISGGTTTQLYGAVDLANYSVNYSGTTSATSGCLNIVAYSFTSSGTSSLSNNCTSVGTTGIGPPSSSSMSSTITVYTAALAN